MYILRSNFFSLVGLSSALLFSMLLLSSCGDAAESADDNCGGHGDFHGDHCDCDTGYSASADGLTCEADQSTDNQTPGNENHDNGSTDSRDLVFNPSSSKGSVGENQDGSAVWIFEAMDGDSMLRFEFYSAYGAPTSPDTVEMTNTETDYSTCGTCVMLRTGCVSHGDHYDCTQTFMPRAQGQVKVSAIGGVVGAQFAGELKDIVLQQVSIGQDYTTTPVPGGEVLHIESLLFDVELEAL